MTLLNHTFSDEDALIDFVQSNDILDSSLLFIQIFYSNRDSKDVYGVRGMLKKIVPNASLVATSTAGIISAGHIHDDAITISFSMFDASRTISKGYCHRTIDEIVDHLDKEVISNDTKLLIIFANTFRLDSTALINKITQRFPEIVLAGGNAGDDFRFERCEVFSYEEDDCDVVVASIQSEVLQVEPKYLLNWQSIGQSMKITQSNGAVVYQVNNKPILDVYRHYLGEEIAESILKYGIEFPLIFNSNGVDVARAPIAADEQTGALTFAGEIPEGSEVKFGYANIGHIEKRNKEILAQEFKYKHEAVYIYSCSARRMMLEGYLTDELLSINQVAPTSGFITYGEFFHDTGSCQNNLLNITTTYVVLKEKWDLEPLDYKHTETEKDEKDITLKGLTTLIERTNEDVESYIQKIKEQDYALIQQSRYTLMGEMISMIAHQWRQPLGAISAQVMNLEFDLNVKKHDLESENGRHLFLDRLDRDLKEINGQVKQLSKTIDSFSNIFKPSEEKELLKIDDILNASLDIMRSGLENNGIELKSDIQSCDKLKVHRNELQQVFLSIISNAQDAILATKRSDGLITIHLTQDKEHITALFCDNGGGIPEADMDKIVDAYYSTKGLNGSGLGLYISKNIIEQYHNGTFSYYNKDAGACFTVCLPKENGTNRLD